jgi:hypothetical protein
MQMIRLSGMGIHGADGMWAAGAPLLVSMSRKKKPDDYGMGNCGLGLSEVSVTGDYGDASLESTRLDCADGYGGETRSKWDAKPCAAN